jgi:hypothetical protein
MTTDEKFDLILKPLMQFVTSTFEFQVFLGKSVIEASPYLSIEQKQQVADYIKSLSSLREKLRNQLEIVLPS